MTRIPQGKFVAETDQQSAPQSQSTFKADSALLSVALIWGINIPLMKNGLDDLNLWVFNALRLIVSAAVLVLFAWAERRRKLRPRADLSWKKVVLFGIAVSGLYQILFLMGIARSTSGNTALIICTIPIWTALMATVFIKEHLAPLAWAGLAIGLVGTAVVAWQKGDVDFSEQLAGNLLVLGSAIVWSACTVYSRPMMARISPLQLSASAAVIALPLHILAAVNDFPAAWSKLNDPTIWWIILYSGTLSSGLALPLWNYGVRNAGASHAAVVQNIIPLIAIIAAWLTRNEMPNAPQMIGGLLILTGLGVMRMGRAKKSSWDSRK